jgi:hypothetical protein
MTNIVDRMRERANAGGYYSAEWEEAANRMEQLEIALKFLIRCEEVNEVLAKAAGEPYVNKGLDFARTLVVMEKKDGLP